jgi:hypothetical protein
MLFKFSTISKKSLTFNFDFALVYMPTFKFPSEKSFQSEQTSYFQTKSKNYFTICIYTLDATPLSCTTVIPAR